MAWLPVGTTLQRGRYEIVDHLGRGPTGAAYLARDAELSGRLCVVKQMWPLFSTPSERRQAEKDFVREANLLVQLNDPGHPGIHEVYGYFVEGADRFLVMRYIQGAESLYQRLKRLGHPLSESDVLWPAREVANVLAYLHSRQPQPVIHGDIKPHNVMVDAEERVWLVDFGLAKAATTDESRVILAEGRILAAGTPGYAPLEQWQGRATPRSDIYALGATMHHLLTGQDPREPFAAVAELDLELLRRLSIRPPLAQVRPDVSPALASLVDRCLDPDPERRPGATHLELELQRLAPAGHELAEAGRIQAGLLPETLPVLANWDVAAAFEPARETSGDFYDFIPLPDGRLAIVVADVADKGAGAALYMALARTLLRSAAALHPQEPGQVLAAVHERIVTETHTDMFVTVFYAVLDPENSIVLYASGGHNPGYVFQAGEAHPLAGTGTALGIMPSLLPDARWETDSVTLSPGDTLLLYTDGAIDARAPDGPAFGLERMLIAARARLGRPAAEVQAGLLDEIHRFVGDAPRFDDLTLMVVART